MPFSDGVPAFPLVPALPLRAAVLDPLDFDPDGAAWVGGGGVGWTTVYNASNAMQCEQAVIFGPDDTPWEGGTFKLLLEFSEDYPNKPPSVRFLTRM